MTRRTTARHQCGAALLAGLALAAAGGGCGPVQLASTWRRAGITPDGSAGDWGSDLVYIEKLQADVGVVNDDSTLYLCLIVRDKNVQQQMAISGLNVWFEPQAEGELRTGVRFPVRTAGAAPAAPERGPGGRRPQAAGAAPPPPLPADEIEILEDSTSLRMKASDVPGVRVAIQRSPSRALVYELAIPLARSEEHPYAVGARPGDVVDVEFEVASPERPKRRGMSGGEGEPGEGAGEPGESGPVGGPPGGDMGGSGGGMGGPGGGGMGGGPGGRGGFGGPGGPGGRGGRPGEASEPWQAKARVKLALPA